MKIGCLKNGRNVWGNRFVVDLRNNTPRPICRMKRARLQKILSLAVNKCKQQTNAAGLEKRKYAHDGFCRPAAPSYAKG